MTAAKDQPSATINRVIDVTGRMASLYAAWWVAEFLLGAWQGWRSAAES